MQRGMLPHWFSVAAGPRLGGRCGWGMLRGMC